MHTMVQGFGLTLGGTTQSWFLSLKADVLYDFETLIKKFIQEHTKIGIKHSTANLILSFKQDGKETVKQCIDCLKQYIARCTRQELPNEEKLISCFLEGLACEELYV